MKGPDLALHIEELVLHGFGAASRAGLDAAIERELTRLFTERGIPPSFARGGAVASLDGGVFEAPSSPDGDSLGTQIAGAVYRGASR